MKDFYNKHRKGFKVFFKVLRTVVLILGLLWSLVLIVVNTFPYKEVVTTAANVLDTSVTNLYVDPSPFATDNLNKIYIALFQPMYIVSGVSALLGIVILSRGRNTLELVGLFLGSIIPRQRKYWGIIFDQSTNAPITFATLRVLKKDETGKEIVVASAVTDLDGRYRIHLEDKNEEYILQIKAEGYKPFEKVIEYKYQQLIKSTIVEDIPLTKLDNRPNLWKRFVSNMRPRLYTFTIYFLFLYTIFSFIWASYGLIAFFWYDTVIAFGLYGFAFVWNILIIRERLTSKTGRILDAKTKKPIGGAMIRVFDESRQIVSALSSDTGTVKLDLEPGSYVIKVDKENYQAKGVNEKGDMTVKVGQEGYLSGDIYLNKIDETKAVSSDLMNPFGN